METIQSPQELKRRIKDLKKTDKKIGLVPTMGALHEGHLSLIRQARKDCSLVVTSIFVNPTQFAPNEDYLSYPRHIERDTELAAQAGTDILFTPLPSQMYLAEHQTFIEVTRLSRGLCGYSRPGHFTGVATVVCKLFNIINADYAYFGQKDYQQVQVVKRMSIDLNMDTEVIMMPIVREEDGLAISSRNSYLNSEERKAAVILYKALLLGKELIENGENRAVTVREAMEQLIEQEKLAQIDYIEICNPENLTYLREIAPGNALLALAVKIGTTRLIDNMLV